MGSRVLALRLAGLTVWSCFVVFKFGAGLRFRGSRIGLAREF